MTSLFLLFLSFAEAQPGAPCGGGRAAQIAEDFVEEINALRARRNLTRVKLHPALCAFARDRAREIAAQEDPEFELLSDDELFRRAEENGYRARYLAELAVHSEGTIESVVSTWPAHVRETALDRGVRDLGVGSERNGRASLYVLFFGLSLQDDFARMTRGLADRETAAREMLERVNAERRKARLPALGLNPALSRAAQAHADDMLARDFYAHITPEGRSPLHRVQAAGFTPSSVAENIARGQFSVEEVMDGWMESDVHRVNILDRSYTQVGLGMAHGINNSGPAVIWVQVFASPRMR